MPSPTFANSSVRNDTSLSTPKVCCCTRSSILLVFSDGGIWLLAFGQFPFLAKLFADSAYAGSIFHTALAKVLPNLQAEIVKRSDRARGFVPLPRRWIVERTIAWLNRCRRLAKDWENLNRNALAFLKLASIRLMLRKLCNH